MAGGRVFQAKAAVLPVRRWPRRVALLATVTYWAPSLGIDLLCLLNWRLTEISAQRTLRLLVVQSLVYLAIWTLITIVYSIATAAPPELAARRRTAPGEGAPFRR